MEQVPPLALSTIICDKVLLDGPTKTSSIISIRDRIIAPKYPVRFPQLFFFAEMTNGHRETEIAVRLVDVQNNEKVLVERKAKVKFVDVKTTVSVVLGFEGLIFEHPGEYCFQLFAAGTPLSERRIVCLLLKRPGNDKQCENPDT